MKEKTGQSFFLPQEETAEILKKGKKLTIGLLSDLSRVEYRIPLTPEAVELLVSYGHDVYIETGAGVAANYPDKDYSKSGAQIIEEKSQVMQCDMILSVASFNAEEVNMLRGNQALFSHLQLNTQSDELIRGLMHKKTTAIAYEYIENDNGNLPVKQLMNQIAGIAAVNIANEYLSKSRNGKGILLGGITGVSPTELVILGANTISLFAAKAALGMGAAVKIFDDDVFRLRNLEEKLGQRIFTSVLYPNVLKKALKSADVVLGATSPNSMRHMRVSSDIVRKMKKGAVIIDLNMDNGGCFETSRCTDLNHPAYIEHNVVHYCVPNISSLAARTASIAMSNVLTPLILSISEVGGVQNFIKTSKSFRKGVYMFNGMLTNQMIGSMFNISSNDIDLLMTVF